MSESVPRMPADHIPRAHAVSTRRLAIVLSVLFTLLLLGSVANLYLTLTRTVAACSFYRDLAGLPVTTVAGQKRPSELGISIIAHSRESFRASGCSGKLPPPSLSFVKWAPYYHLNPK